MQEADLALAGCVEDKYKKYRKFPEKYLDH